MPDREPGGDHGGARIRKGPNQREDAQARPGETRNSGAESSPEMRPPSPGDDYSQRAFADHVDLLSDTRMSQPMYSQRRAEILRQLQRAYGNRYVQRLVDHIAQRQAGPVSSTQTGNASRDLQGRETGSAAPEVEDTDSIGRSWARRRPADLTLVTPMSSTGEAPVQRVLSTEQEQYLQTYPVAAELVRNINLDTDDEATQLRKLVTAFNNCGFTYTILNHKGPETFLKGDRTGDCGTLAEAYTHVANNFLCIGSVKTKAKSADFYVPNGGAVNDSGGAAGNIDGGPEWVFATHTWVDESPIGKLDLLFNGAVPAEGTWVNMTDSGKSRDIEYREFGDIKVYRWKYGSDYGEQYTTHLDRAVEANSSRDVKDVMNNERVVVNSGEKPSERGRAFFEDLASPPQKKKWCFITTACVEAMGLPDDCYELETLRAFRDGYMSSFSSGPSLISEYYEIAPKIVAAIKAQPNADEILAGLFQHQIRESVRLIESGNHEQAMRNYIAIVEDLKEEYLTPAAAGVPD